MDAAAKHRGTPQAKRADAGKYKDCRADDLKKLRRIHAAKRKREREQGQSAE
jgi:hypothetical protein